jgi:arylsulfatase A-like enzyme
MGLRSDSQAPTPTQSQERPNLIIILLDTLSAQDLSLYGYPRETTPNLTRLAGRATVYHRHHSAGNFTTPSTASLLSGVYPWTHRAFHQYGMVEKSLASRNIFNLLGDKYRTVGFAQNQLADILLYQFGAFIDEHIKFGTYNLLDRTIYDNIFPKDSLAAYRSFDQYLFYGDLPGSLYLSHLQTMENIADYNAQVKKYRFRYPKELPDAGDRPSAFVLRPLFDGILDLLGNQPNPFFAYLHLFPTHYPYAPSKEFIGIFREDPSPIAKTEHFFSQGETQQRLDGLRMQYDEYIAHTDAELGRLIDHLEETGLLGNSFLVVTSDHGELFERGVHGHTTPLLFEPVTHIPLLISSPGQNQRIDVHTPTSNIDLLPTILSLTGQAIPDWCEGEILPGSGGKASPGRSIFSVEAKTNSAFKALSKATIALFKDSYKLIHYRGYPGHDGVSELYNLENDPEELDDRYTIEPAVAEELETELMAKLEGVNRPYQT